jgi:nucleotidyltransferase substrate binding protein (TIGR01987 family)
MPDSDIRWTQRFVNFKKAFAQLERFLTYTQLNEMEQQGLIKAFEYTFELSWKTLQDLLKEKGYLNIVGPRPVIEKSFEDGYIENGTEWMKMHKSRNLTSHTYDQETAEEIIEAIRNNYFALLLALKIRFEQELSGNQTNLFP